MRTSKVAGCAGGASHYGGAPQFRVLASRRPRPILNLRMHKAFPSLALHCLGPPSVRLDAREARRTAPDAKQNQAARIMAIRTLGLAPFAEVHDLFGQLLQLRQPQPIQTAALETLAHFDQPGVPTLLVNAWTICLRYANKRRTRSTRNFRRGRRKSVRARRPSTQRV